MTQYGTGLAQVLSEQDGAVDLKQLVKAESLTINNVHFPLKRIRPLGQFSDFVVRDLGGINELVREKLAVAVCLEEAIVEVFESVPDSTLAALEGSQHSAEARTAMLDMCFAERSLAVANSGIDAYKLRRPSTRMFRWMRRLAISQRRNPLLSWSDIAIRHPTNDPRSFLASGNVQDQEVLMYRIQSAIERVFRKLLFASWSGQHEAFMAASDAVLELKAVVAAMVYLSKVRTVGQFYKLDPFLGVNGDVRGHATGAFSAWTFLMALRFTGSASAMARICDPGNRKAFDSDAWSMMEAMVGSLRGRG